MVRMGLGVARAYAVGIARVLFEGVAVARDVVPILAGSVAAAWLVFAQFSWLFSPPAFLVRDSAEVAERRLSQEEARRELAAALSGTGKEGGVSVDVLRSGSEWVLRAETRVPVGLVGVPLSESSSGGFLRSGWVSADLWADTVPRVQLLLALGFAWTFRRRKGAFPFASAVLLRPDAAAWVREAVDLYCKRVFRSMQARGSLCVRLVPRRGGVAIRIGPAERIGRGLKQAWLLFSSGVLVTWILGLMFGCVLVAASLVIGVAFTVFALALALFELEPAMWAWAGPLVFSTLSLAVAWLAAAEWVLSKEGRPSLTGRAFGKVRSVFGQVPSAAAGVGRKAAGALRSLADEGSLARLECDRIAEASESADPKGLSGSSEPAGRL